MIRFYFKKGRWHVTSEGQAEPADRWFMAVNHVKHMNHKLRMNERKAREVPPRG